MNNLGRLLWQHKVWWRVGQGEPAYWQEGQGRSKRKCILGQERVERFLLQSLPEAQRELSVVLTRRFYLHLLRASLESCLRSQDWQGINKSSIGQRLQDLAKWFRDLGYLWWPLFQAHSKVIVVLMESNQSERVRKGTRGLRYSHFPRLQLLLRLLLEARQGLPHHQSCSHDAYFPFGSVAIFSHPQAQADILSLYVIFS